MDLQSIKNRFGIIGNSPSLNHALNTAAQVANTDLTVLIIGESGVGKEVFSHIIHSLSSRKHNPFIAVNCGAIPEGTIDSELFGHEKGAFTGAVDSRKGYFETVNGGTIFLDEIGEMPLSTQARLLRVLETGEFIRVGSSKVQKTDVRVIGATNRDLLDQTRGGRFREDLYYRLSTVPIKVPALRDRKEDIALLFRKFASDFSERYRTQSVQLDAEAQKMLVTYTWPGNVRELKNVAEQVSVLATDRYLTAKEFYGFLPQHNSTALVRQGSGMNSTESISATERDILYKLFFDLKKDMTDLKRFILEMAGQQGFKASVPLRDQEGYGLPSSMPLPVEQVVPDNAFVTTPYPERQVYISGGGDSIDRHEDVEENLFLADREKEFIIKALKKHKGRRRDASNELGISERTLYRKIKEYDIDE